MKRFNIRSVAPYGAHMVEYQVEHSTKKGDKSDNIVESAFALDVPLNDDGSPNVLPIDQFSGKSFLLNECGFPTNDIMAYEEAQNDALARTVLSRLNMQAQNRGDGLSLQQRFDRICPANWSSPAEYVRMSKRLAEMQYADGVAAERAVAERAAAEQKQQPVKSNVVTTEPE